MIKKILASLAGIILMIISYAQTPDMYPPPNPEPIEKTTFNIVLYVVLPIIMVVGYLLYRKSVKKRNEKDK